MFIKKNKCIEERIKLFNCILDKYDRNTCLILLKILQKCEA